MAPPAFLHSGENLRSGDEEVKQGQGNGTPGWGFSLFGYSMEGPKMVGEEDSVDQYFPWEVVEQSLQDTRLERRHGVKQEYLVEARSCPKCEAPPEQLRWIYVRPGEPVVRVFC